MKRIIVGSLEDAKRFRADGPYAVISFVGHRYHKTPPKLAHDPKRLARIVVRTDDTYPGIAGTIALSDAQADRIAAFVRQARLTLCLSTVTSAMDVHAPPRLRLRWPSTWTGKSS